MPMSQSYKDRLFPILPQLAAHYGTPFHIYDEAGIPGFRVVKRAG